MNDESTQYRVVENDHEHSASKAPASHCPLCERGMPWDELYEHIRFHHNVTVPEIFNVLLPVQNRRIHATRVLKKYRCKSCGFSNPEKAFVLSPHRHHSSIQEGGRFESETLRLIPVLKRVSEPTPFYECGEQVIVKLKFFPWWPAILLQPPGRLDDLKSHYDPDKRKYHVGYFSDKTMLRGWVPENDIQPFACIRGLPGSNRRDYKAAMSWANHCESWSNEKRRLKFCFATIS